MKNVIVLLFKSWTCSHTTSKIQEKKNTNSSKLWHKTTVRTHKVTIKRDQMNIQTQNNYKGMQKDQKKDAELLQRHAKMTRETHNCKKDSQNDTNRHKMATNTQNYNKRMHNYCKEAQKKKNYKGPPSIFTRTPVYYYNRRGKIVNLLFKAVFTICIANHFRSWDVRAHVWVREGSIGSQGDVMVSGWGWENMETARARFGVPTHHTRYWDPVHRQKTK